MAKEFIVYSATKEAFQTAVTAGTVDRSQIGIIADTAEVWINGQYLPSVELSDYLSKAALSVEPIEQKFTWRVATDDRKLTDSLAVVNKIIGNTIQWSQLIDGMTTNNANNTAFVDREGNVSVSYNNGEITITNSATKTKDYSNVTIFGELSSVNLQIGHKYLICADRAHYGIGIVEGARTFPFRQVNSVFTALYNAKPTFAISPDYDFSVEHSYSGDGLTVIQKTISMKLNLFDLTEMFGSGNEPKSLGEFRRLYPRPYYDACVTPKVRGVVIDSFASPTYNLWNKEEAVQGAIMYATGWLRSDAWYKKWRTYIMPVSPNTRYYLKDVANRSQCMPCVYFDADMKWVGYDGPQDLNTGADSTSGEIVTPDNVSYMAVMVYKDFIGDACVSVSSRRNGDYEEYIASGASLSAITELKDAKGNKVFPYGLLEGGGVFDEVGEGYAIQRVDYELDSKGEIVKTKRLYKKDEYGNLIYDSNDKPIPTFNYYSLSNRLWMTWRLRRGGTERIQLDDVSAPFRATISYALDANDLLPAPLEEKRDASMKIIAMDEDGNTYKSANYARSSDDIKQGSKDRIPDCEIVRDYVKQYVSDNKPTTIATAPKREVQDEAVEAYPKYEQSPNVVYEYPSIMLATILYISLLSPSDNYAQTWTLRLIPHRPDLQIKFYSSNDSSIAIKWVDGAPPTWSSSDVASNNVFEIVIRQFGYSYIGDWKVYK